MGLNSNSNFLSCISEDLTLKKVTIVKIYLKDNSSALGWKQ